MDAGHEIAVHGKMHMAPGLSRPVDCIQDMLSCRLELEKTFDRIVRGMAYPDSGITNMQNEASYDNIRSYLQDLVGSNSRPVQQLIDFQKVAFTAYERKTLTFTVTEEMLRFWNNEHKLVSEPGAFELSTSYVDHLQHTKRFELV